MTQIPKIIHQTYIDRERLKIDKPEWFKMSQECIYLNQDFEYIFWGDMKIQTFMEQNFAWFIPTFNSFPHLIQKIDAFRYAMLEYFGGFYIDMDIKCLKPFDDLLKYLQIT